MLDILLTDSVNGPLIPSLKRIIYLEIFAEIYLQSDQKDKVGVE